MFSVEVENVYVRDDGCSVMVEASVISLAMVNFFKYSLITVSWLVQCSGRS